MEIQCNKARLFVEFHESADPEEARENPGATDCWRVDSRILSYLIKKYKEEIWLDELIMHLEERHEDTDIIIPAGDNIIISLYMMGQEGGTFNFEYHGNEYWFFHDLNHALNDCHPDLYVSDWAEEQALIEGAKMAFRNKVSIGKIFRELILVEPIFQDSYNYSSNSVERFSNFLSASIFLQQK